ncbi:MAG TPA: NADH-ubiquinone oxidoreductase-F iron-sulfur binding region domain-containing protein, partial [Fimbriimonas sp.]|nr:NADH-ubiquinone oxidoreductase-F iron-sulfur binding region domain-containing protein [Fimbriimonas sp.]
MELLVQVADQIEGRSFCALGDAAAWPVKAFIRQFPEEFQYWIENGKSPIRTDASLAYAN